MGCTSSKSMAIARVPSILNLTQHDDSIIHRADVGTKFSTRDTPLDLTQHSVHQKEVRYPLLKTDLKDDTYPVSIDVDNNIIKGAAIMSRKGIADSIPKKANQDSYFYFSDVESNTFVMGILDGHGEFGEIAANFLSSEIPSLILGNKDFEFNLPLAIQESIAAAESMLIQRQKVHLAFSGTTLNLVAIRGSHLIIANVGDSRAIIGGPHAQTEQLSRDHKASLKDESDRIRSAGGRVITKTYEDGYIGPARVYLGTADLPGLAMSRSLGDIIVHEAGVSSVPEISERELCCSDKYIILATDGVWDFVANDEVMDVATTSNSPADAIEGIMHLSLARWKINSPRLVDDTTVGVIELSLLPSQSS